ncbi:aromatic acid exporter family protein [Bacillus tuaregi]|uniref:aromatic acid exporter family protein n=1 Tax=Bacillus tuaregi TaxID=1816695 RepID=UPI0008F96E88|nr:aromatic acid exporter family protein [Bacillus tuaregi]
MKLPRSYKFIGGRITKTGIAVLVTALICHVLDWPAMFAVITAIVTIEPTAADSIKKAFIRFPASAIGAGFAVIFTFLFGDSPVSYTLVSLLTIIACHKLRLYDGMLVATLTGVAMITTVHDDYLTSFLIRLGTTSTGLIVSSLVNVFLIPPNYSKSITEGIHGLFKNAGDVLDKKAAELYEVPENEKDLQQLFEKLHRDIEKIKRYCQYHKAEMKFHRSNRNEIRDFLYDTKKLKILQQIEHHLGNLIELPFQPVKIDHQKLDLLKSVFQSLSRIFNEKNDRFIEEDEQLIIRLSEWLSEQWALKHDADYYIENHHHISSETAILYELISIYDLAEELNQLHDLEVRHKQLLR